jgi:hypothetical protein
MCRLIIIIPGTHLLTQDSSFTIGSTGFPSILFYFIERTLQAFPKHNGKAGLLSEYGCYQKDKQCKYNVTMRRVLATIVVVEKQ